MTWVGVAHAQAPVGGQPGVDPRFANAFDGWSLGFGAGYNLFSTPTSIDSFGEYSDAVSPTLQGNGPFATVEVGRDFRVNNALFGIYGDFHIGEKAGSFTSSDSYDPSAGLALQEGGSLTARAGFLPNQRTALYGLFGWSWQHYTAHVSSSSYSELGLGATGSGVLNGPTVGLGAEVLLPNNPNISFKTEYRYTRFNAPAPLVPGSGPESMTFGNVDDHMLRFILSFKLPAGP